MLGTRTLMREVIDYAGLFPPAKLDMEPTVRNYAALRDGAESWMLGRLIVPVARLDEFERCAAPLLPLNGDLPHDRSWQVSAITAPAGEAAFTKDLDAIAVFNERHAQRGAGGAVIDAIEARVADVQALERALDEMPEWLYPWFELPVDRDVRGFVAALADMDAGAKVRTGGVDAAAHPAPEALARFIDACRLARVPFKATAGLHHAVRRHVPEVKTKQFGFLNVLIGAALAWHERIDAKELVMVLDDEERSHFVLDDDGAGWCDHRLATRDIERARERFVHSFGSCSFDEPLEELRSLGALGEART